MSQGPEELLPLPENFSRRLESLSYPEDLFAGIQCDKDELRSRIRDATVRVNDLIAAGRSHQSVYLDVYELSESGEEEDPTEGDKEISWDRNLRILENLYQKFNIGPNDYKTIEWEDDPDHEIKYCYEIVRFSPGEDIAFIEYYGYFDTQHVVTADYSDPPDIFDVEVITLRKGRLPRNLQRYLD